NLTKETFAELPGLVHLVLSYSDVISVSDDAFEGMTSLLVLILNENKLSSVPAAIKPLHNLRELDLSMNKILQISNGDFRGLDRLKILKMDSNIGIEFSADALLPLEETLHTLSLMWCDLAEVPSEITILQHLQRLDLSGNLLTQIEDNVFLGLDRLEMLDLSENF
ncbi:hypothetical protein CAPTEDRAFT_85439, partial [Capitella teleta]|uniref:Uncharacterized protein n=1 Tax=Capitella teleta TaxID=283909 RepID=X2BA32_CAPTE